MAAEVLKDALQGKLEASITPQIIYELYAVVTDGRRIEHPLPPVEAADICLDLWESRALEKLTPTSMAFRGVLSLAERLELKGGDIFDCVLAITAKENQVETLYTQNTDDFKGYQFLEVLNPLDQHAREAR